MFYLFLVETLFFKLDDRDVVSVSFFPVFEKSGKSCLGKYVQLCTPHELGLLNIQFFCSQVAILHSIDVEQNRSHSAFSAHTNLAFSKLLYR